ncbi:OLC1v1031646C2 [Oldenlandia corymbosa var. corymbosa]|uniref:OLC1v1031646C2 n=1 Tax=Oldenlandia corymbosa var. corymbosa TaxID=529605 RepID=A0AAV1CM53_OLDCO|nr:OLC1v1031646C2 [Oldenlandia corymbosa var. corymbosa]
MSTNVLPQALFMVPRNGTERGLTKLRCAALVSGRPSSLCSSVSLHSTGFFSGSFKGLRDIVVVRAEENSAEAEVENVGSEEPVEGAEAEEEEVVETEDRPPRTPRIKLGDIMGILNKRAIEESDTVRPTPDIRTGDIVEIKLVKLLSFLVSLFFKVFVCFRGMWEL